MSEPENPPPATLGTRLREIAGFVAPTTVATALLIYFGAVYTDGRLAYYGIQLGLADLTTQDLILYGTEAVYVPLAWLLLAVLAAFAGHAAVARLLDRPGQRLVRVLVAGIAVVVGLLFVARALIGILDADVATTEMPGLTGVMLAVGPLLIAYGAWAGGLLRQDSVVPFRHGIVATVVVLALTGLFWATNRFAFELGLNRSYAEVLDTGGLYRVVLDTGEPLADPLPAGVTRADLPPAPEGSENPFRYRYRGLRVVLESGGRLFLAPDAWTRDGRTLVLPYDGSVRIELIPPPDNLE